MPNTLNYAESFSPDLLEIYRQETLISPFLTTNVKFVGARSFHFTQMSTTGFRNHSRKGGWNMGEITQKDTVFTLNHDRDVAFLVDIADIDETNQTAAIKNVSETFIRTQGTPEANALFFSTVAAKAESVTGLHSETALSAFTVENVYGKLKAALNAGKLKLYRSKGALIMYVCSEIMDLLERSKDFTRKIEMTQIAEGGIGIETRVTSIDGVTLMEVMDDDVFYDKFNYDPTVSKNSETVHIGGFEPDTTAKKINFLIASPLTAKYVLKISSIYFFARGSHTEGDGDLYQNRSLSDVFVFPNGLNNEIDSIYVDVRAAETQSNTEDKNNTDENSNPDTQSASKSNIVK